MFYRVTIYSTAGDPMLFRDFGTRHEARLWKAWAESTLPCRAHVGRIESAEAHIPIAA